MTTRLAALVRHQLVRPDRAQLAGDDAYRFRHLLIRDAAYEALPKAVRADLHVSFADWLDEHGHALVERDEIVGYHLEQAARYRAELGQPDPGVAEQAALRLATAGRRAVDRLDMRAASALLDRAAELVPHRTDLTLELESAWAQDLDVRAAVETAEAVTERAEAAGDHSGALLARALALYGRNVAGEPDTTDELIALCRAALPPEEERGDPRRLARSGRCSPLRRTSACRRRRRRSVAPGASLPAPPADDAMRMMDELAVSRPPGSQDLPRAALLAMLGRFNEAWPLAEARSSHLREVTGNTSQDAYGYLSLIATIEGDRERACRYRAETIEVIAHAAIPAATAKSHLARDLCYLARFDEAERLLEEARAVPPPGSGVRVMAAAAEALLLTQRGELEQAEALARTAVATAETRTDNVWWQAWTLADLATVLERAGRIDEARDALERSFALWERKGCLPCAARVREQIDSLGRAQV